jgi:hypothetical protein
VELERRPAGWASSGHVPVAGLRLESPFPHPKKEDFEVLDLRSASRSAMNLLACQPASGTAGATMFRCGASLVLAPGLLLLLPGCGKSVTDPKATFESLTKRTVANLTNAFGSPIDWGDLQAKHGHETYAVRNNIEWDVEKTNSLVSPETGLLKLVIDESGTVFAPNPVAVKRIHFVSFNVAFQDDKWILKSAEDHQLSPPDSLFPPVSTDNLLAGRDTPGAISTLVVKAVNDALTP